MLGLLEFESGTAWILGWLFDVILDEGTEVEEVQRLVWGCAASVAED